MRIIELLRKEYFLFKRSRKQVGTVLIMPFLFAIIYLFMFSNSDINLDITVCNLDQGEYSQTLINSLSSSFQTRMEEGDNITHCTNLIEEDIRSGRMLGIVIKNNFSTKINEYESPTLQLYYDNSKPNLGFFAQSYLMNHVTGFNNEVLRNSEEMIKSTTNNVENDLQSTLNLLAVMNNSIPLIVRESYNNLYYDVEDYYNQLSVLNEIDLEFLVKPVNTQLIGVFQGSNSEGFSFCVLYTVLNLIIILLLSSVSMVYDKKNNFFARLKTSTTPILYYLLSKVLFFALISFLIFIPSFLVFYFNNAYFNINLATLLIGLIMTSAVSTIIGCVIGLSSNNESSSTMLSIFIGFLFLLLSGLFYPIDLLPGFVNSLLNFLPTSFEINVLNHALVFNSSVNNIQNSMSYLTLYLITLLGLSHYMIIKD